MEKIIRECFRERQLVKDQISFLSSHLNSISSVETARRDYKALNGDYDRFDYSLVPDYVAYKERRWNATVEGLTREMPRILPSGSFEDSEEPAGDFSVTQASVSTICPISRCTFHTPVRSRRCKHTYEEAAIQALLRGVRTIECPVAGCRKAVGEQDLERDVDMVRRVQRNNASKRGVFSQTSKR